jgi:cob(I)alamin adenosyltransferase
MQGKQKESLVVVYTGDGKGKTSAGLGLVCRALGAGSKVAFIQFIKSWQVSEDAFFTKIAPLFDGKLVTHKGGKGFYNAGSMSAANVSVNEHKLVACKTYNLALEYASSGDYDLVVCDEINNAVHDGLLSINDLKELIYAKHEKTSLCLTGRNFPVGLMNNADILTEMKKQKHHFDDGFIANQGIDF